jgi:SpoVK/Ycf46/Vps4 family AAA+-type ATPase
MILCRCDLDSALLRRFERRIEGEAANRLHCSKKNCLYVKTVPLPNNLTRASLFDLFLAKTEVDGDIDTEVLAQLTEGFSGADIESACREAALKGVRDFFTKETNDMIKVRSLNQQDLLEAVHCCRGQLIAQVSNHASVGERNFVCKTCRAIKQELDQQHQDHE